MRTIIVPVPEGVAERVAELARVEFRTPKAQATVLLMEALARRGVRTAEQVALAPIAKGER